MKKINRKWITKNQSSRLYNIPVPIVGLTGGIATGKSTVARLFREKNIPVIDADLLVKGIYNQSSSLHFVKTHFPSAIENNSINFKRLREFVFTIPENQILIENFIYAELPDAFRNAFSVFHLPEFIIYDVPLLFEKKLNDKIDVSICVYTTREIQLERLIKRDHVSQDLARSIMDKQMDIEEKKKISDLVIENNSDYETLERNFEVLFGELTN